MNKVSECENCGDVSFTLEEASDGVEEAYLDGDLILDISTCPYCGELLK